MGNPISYRKRSMRQSIDAASDRARAREAGKRNVEVMRQALLDEQEVSESLRVRVAKLEAELDRARPVMCWLDHDRALFIRRDDLDGVWEIGWQEPPNYEERTSAGETAESVAFTCAAALKGFENEMAALDADAAQPKEDEHG